MPAEPPPPRPASHDPYAAFRVTAFRWFVASSFSMTVGAQIQAVIVGWQVYALTRDPLALGMIGLAEALPYIATALYAGHVADRHDRKRIALASLAVLVACSAALLWLTQSGAVREAPGRAALYVVIVVSGVARSFLQPARSGIGVEIVPRALYANAVTWRSSTWQVAAVLGPAIGGGLYAWGGATLSYAVDMALMIVALLAMLRLRYVPGERPPRADEGTWASLTSGLHFVRRQPIVIGAMSLDLFSVLFGGATALLPIFAAEVLHVGASGLGLLRAAPAAGAVAVSLLLAHRPPMRRAGRAMLGGVALFGVCMIGFALSREFWLSLAFLAGSGAVDMVSVVVRQTLLQTMTPAHLMGRVSSVNAIFVGSSNEIGAFESGVAAKLIGAVPAVFVGGCLTLVVVAVTAWRVPALRRLGRLDGLAPPDTPELPSAATPASPTAT